MANQTPVKDDPKQLAAAQELWDKFIKSSQLSIVLIAIVVLLLAVVFVPSGS